MNKSWGRSGSGHVLAGLLVTSIGVIFLLNNLGIIEARDILRLWFLPVVLIAMGIAQLLAGRSNQ